MDLFRKKDIGALRSMAQNSGCIPSKSFQYNKTAEASTHFTMRIGRLRMSNIFYKCT